MVKKLFDPASGSRADREHFYSDSGAIVADPVQCVRALLQEITFIGRKNLLFLSDSGRISCKFLIDRLDILHGISSL